MENLNNGIELSKPLEDILKNIKPSFTTVPLECFQLVHTSNFLGRQGWFLFTGKDITIFRKNDYILEYDCINNTVKLVLNGNLLSEGEILDVLNTIDEKQPV